MLKFLQSIFGQPMVLLRDDGEPGAGGGNDDPPVNEPPADPPEGGEPGAPPGDQDLPGISDEEKAVLEARKQRETFYQQRHDNLLRVAEAQGIDTDKLKEGARRIEADDKPPDPPAPKTKPKMPDSFMDTTPTEFMEAFGDELVSRISRANQESLSRLTYNQQVEAEGNAVAQELGAIAEKLELTPDEINMALAEAAIYEIDRSVPRGQAKFGVAVSRAMERIGREKGTLNNVRLAVMKSEEQARIAALTGQPPKAAAPPAARRTLEQKALDDMFSAGPKGQIGLLDSTRAGE